MKKDKISYNQVVSVVFVILLTIIGSSTIIVKDETISTVENRSLVSFEDLSKTTFFDGSFQSSLEKAMSDQFIGRYWWVNTKKNIDYQILNIAYLGSDFDTILRPLSDSGVMQIGNTRYMIDTPLVYNEVAKSRVVDRVNQINEFAKRNPTVNVVTYLPINQHETAVFDESNELKSAGPLYIKEISDHLSTPYTQFPIKDMEDIYKYYFSSDHHMNYLGTYKMYSQILQLIDPNIKPTKPTSTDCHVGQSFYGTFSSRTGYLLEPDEFCTYTFSLNDFKVEFNNEVVDPQTVNDFVTYDPKASKDKYPYYYNIAAEVFEPLASYDFNQPTKPNVLLVGDSLSRAFIDVFASSFNKTWRLVPYEYTTSNGEYFDYDQFILDNDIDVVVFCYGLVNYYYKDQWGDRFLDTTIAGGGS